MKPRDFVIGFIAVAVCFYLLGFAAGKTSAFNLRWVENYNNIEDLLLFLADKARAGQ